MNKLSRRTFLGAGTAALAIAAGQLGSSQRATAQSSGQLNLYSSRHYDSDDLIYRGFTDRTGIKINLLEGKADELIERIRSEGQNSPADVLMTVDVARLLRAEQAGILTPIDSSELERRIPANLRHPEGLWFGLTKRARVLMHNGNVDPGVLTRYEDLAEPRWRGKVVVRSSSHVYNQSLVASLIAHLGEAATEEWCKGVVANFARPPKGNDRAQITAVAAGQANIAIANTYYLPRYAPGGANADPAIFNAVNILFPNQGDRGAHINISGAGVVKTGRNRDEAVRFLEYLTELVSQSIFAEANNEYPVVEGVPLAPVVESFGKFKEDSLNVAELG
ncbi:MAG: extracellular solute-binding protein, partial [Cyanobacteria bacterium J06641_5]